MTDVPRIDSPRNDFSAFIYGYLIAELPLPEQLYARLQMYNRIPMTREARHLINSLVTAELRRAITAGELPEGTPQLLTFFHNESKTVSVFHQPESWVQAKELWRCMDSHDPRLTVQDLLDAWKTLSEQFPQWFKEGEFGDALLSIGHWSPSATNSRES